MTLDLASVHLPLLVETEEFLFFNKPSGLSSAPVKEGDPVNAVSLALSSFPQLEKMPEPEHGLLHRLDRGTSGCLVFAKDPHTFLETRKIWGDGNIKKTYRARVSFKKERERHQVAVPHSPEPYLEIKLPIGRSSKSIRKMIVEIPGSRTPQSALRGPWMKAVSRIRLFEKITADLFDFEIQIETGVMHQIRVHLASLGYPILGDTSYGGQPSERIWLHAWKLEIPIQPHLEKLIQVEAPLPQGWHSLKATSG